MLGACRGRNEACEMDAVLARSCRGKPGSDVIISGDVTALGRVDDSATAARLRVAFSNPDW